MSYDFAWDDQMLIIENRNLRAANPLELFGQVFWPDPTGEGYYRPVVALSYWVERRVWGLNPLGFHLTNVLLNCLVAGLAVFVLARLLRRDEGAVQAPISAGKWAASPAVLAAGLLFVLHPAHVESVAFVSGRTDVLMAVLLLTAVLLLARFREKPGWLSGAGVAVTFTFALFCKEAAVLFPVFAFLCLLPSVRHPSRSRAAWLLLGAMVMLAAAYLVARAAILAGETTGWGRETEIQRVFLVVNGFGRYLAQAVWPFHHRLMYASAEGFAAFGWPTVAGVVGFAALAWLAWRCRGRGLGLGAAWFLLFVLPGCNFFPIGVTYFAERLLYLPVLGLILAGAAAFDLVPRPPVRRLALAVVLVYAAVMGFDTLRRMPVWRSNATLYARMAVESPDSPHALYNWGTELDKQGDVPGAMAAYRDAIAVAPDFAQAYNNLGVLLEKTGDAAGAYRAYRRAMELDSSYGTVRYNYAGALKKTGDIQGAIRECRAALELEPWLTQARRNLAQLYLETGDVRAAVDEYQAGLALEPGDAGLHYGLAGAWRDAGELAAAIAEYDNAIRIEPDMVAAHNDRAIVLDMIGDARGALDGFRRAVELRPQDVPALMNLGAMYRKVGDPAAARAAFVRALELDPGLEPARTALKELGTGSGR